MWCSGLWLQQQRLVLARRSKWEFFVVRKPQVRGFKDKGDKDLGLLNNLSYAILNKVRLSYIYDFN